jgi:hypothetical protein
VPRTIADFRAEYAKADALTQEVQLFRNKAGIPAILELRNAGHHLLRAISDEGQLVSQDELVSAISHTRRACYEATEAGIMIALAIAKKFKDDYPKTKASGVIPDYVAKLRRCDEALRAVKIGRQPGYDRDGDHNDRIELFRELRAFSHDLEVGREEMNKVVADERRLSRRFIITVCLMVLGMLLAASFAIWASTGYYSPWKSQFSNSAG